MLYGILFRETYCYDFLNYYLCYYFYGVNYMFLLVLVFVLSFISNFLFYNFVLL